jgi:hypothetical protein
MTYTLTLDNKTFPIADVRSLQFNFSKGSNVTLDIITENNGNFHYECSIEEPEKFNALWMLKNDIGSSLKAIAEGRLKVD